MTSLTDEARRRLERARMLGERTVYRLVGDEEEGSAVERIDSMPEPPGEEGAVSPAWEFPADAWEELAMEASTCTLCELCEGRTQVVWGSGTPRTGLMLIGEAPGYYEDQQGEAFVGRAGQLLTKILKAIGFGRDEVFITNVLKCRPPGNADPKPTQVAACEPYLISQIEMIRPAVLVTLGRHAARTLLGNDSPMGALRGRVFQYQGVPLVATYHPAALLRNPSLKRPTWEDVQLVKRIYDDEMELRASGATAGERP